MLVSCIIPTYKKFEYLEESVLSVLNQDYSEIEIIITDDGSQNFDDKSISAYIEKYKRNNIKNVIILSNKTNVGTVKNMNRAICVAKGEVIIPLASDDTFYSNDVITRIVRRFEDIKCDVLSCTRMFCSEDLSQEYRLMPHPGYRRFISKRMDTAIKQYKSVALGYLMEFASGASMYYKRDFFKNIGGYNEEYLLWEDGPFISKITRNGYKIHTAYDIISINYRDGGISSKAPKSKELSRIEIDYCTAIKEEYLKYSELFSEKEKRILKDMLIIQENRGISFNLLRKAPYGVVHYYVIKMVKFIYRYLLPKDMGNLSL